MFGGAVRRRSPGAVRWRHGCVTTDMFWHGVDKPWQAARRLLFPGGRGSFVQPGYVAGTAGTTTAAGDTKTARCSAGRYRGNARLRRHAVRVARVSARRIAFPRDKAAQLVAAAQIWVQVVHAAGGDPRHPAKPAGGGSSGCNRRSGAFASCCAAAARRGRREAASCLTMASRQTRRVRRWFRQVLF